MNNKRGLRRAAALVLCLVPLTASTCTSRATPAPTPTGVPAAALVAPGGQAADTISGVVVDEEGPVAKAVVRVKTTATETRTDASGRFTLTGLTASRPVTVTAWAEGYFNSGGQAHAPGARDVVIELDRHAVADNPSYAWVSAFSSAGDKANCQNCHSEAGYPDSALPFDEWLRDAHSSSAHNIRFLTVYSGTDVQGSQSPFARFGDSRRFSGTDPLVPDADQPYFGPGFRMDYPYIAGSCSACHAPSSQFSQTFGADPTTLTGVGTEGTTCDLCHKVWDVNLDPDTGLPHRDRPGILSFDFRRPPEGHQFFAGPLDDVAPGEDTFSPIQKESAFCAACHYGQFWDTTVYNSYGEWLASPYSDPETGQTCQNCHMPSTGATFVANPAKGGLARDPSTVVSHQMPGASAKTLLQNAVTMKITAQREQRNVTVAVSITNDRTGHDVPTDSPLRHLILLVRATDAEQQPLQELDGPTVPDWGGVGSPDHGYYAGLPGTAYAKILQEFRSQIFPTAAYWNPTRVLSDNRIPAFGTATTNYTFDASDGQEVTVDVTLLYRRAYRALADEKGWTDPDIVMARQSVRVAEEK
jgi:hypothetical protein